jgi:site-specific recombinase XerD
MTLLRERMAEDLRIRNYSPRTIETYVSMMARFARAFDRPPGQLGPTEIRAFQLGLIEQKVSWSLFNQAVSALRFFYRVTLPRDFAVEHLPFAKHKKSLPLVLSVDEVRRLLAAATNPIAAMAATKGLVASRADGAAIGHGRLSLGALRLRELLRGAKVRETTGPSTARC